MSCHVINSHRNGDRVQVIAGYDRPLRSLFLQIWDDPAAHSRVDQDVLYASHMDVFRDWTQIGSVVAVLDAMAIPVPSDFIDALQDDQFANRGNLIVHHAPVPTPTIRA